MINFIPKVKYNEQSNIGDINTEALCYLVLLDIYLSRKPDVEIDSSDLHCRLLII